MCNNFVPFPATRGLSLTNDAVILGIGTFPRYAGVIVRVKVFDISLQVFPRYAGVIVGLRSIVPTRFTFPRVAGVIARSILASTKRASLSPLRGGYPND